MPDKKRVYGTPVGIPGGGSEKPSSSEGRQTAQPPSEAYIRAELARKARMAADEKPVKRTATPTASSGPSPKDPNNPTRDLSAATAARRIMGYKARIDKAIDE